MARIEGFDLLDCVGTLVRASKFELIIYKNKTGKNYGGPAGI